MSLQVWLPLTKDLRNQGISGATIEETTSAVFDNSGKLGKCLSGGKIKIPASQVGTIFNNTSMSIAFWYNNNTAESSGNHAICGFSGNGEGDTDAVRIWDFFNYSVPTQFHWSMGNLGGGSLANVFPANTWVHVAVTWQSPTLKIYINGELRHTGSGSSNYTFNKSYYISFGRTPQKLNDFRIYDHCLSPMEVKEISKGLVLHYPLNRQNLGPNNLLKNGFGELGNENWTSNTSISTTDIPADQSEIKASFAGYTIEHMKIYPSHTYKFSAWIKGTTTSGNTYPSLFPYDVDGKFIDYHKCPDGFNLNTMTTLKQQLTTGDTKIYVNDLSQWNANSGHYYNWAAIFSYTDGTGYTYPDGTYTQNLGRFGNSTNAKTNLDKTNNIITLTTAYTGPTMPVGTKVCASTEGSTYYYPLGGISLASIQDWTYKEGTFSGDTARLRYAKTVTFWTYSSNRMAGIKLEDITANNLTGITEYDCSGFCNNGTRIGTFTWISDTPKYQVGQVFNGSDNAIQTPNLTTMITDKTYSITCWFKKSSIGTKNYQTIYGGPSGFELEARNGSGTSPQVVAWNWGKPLANYTFDTWNHFVFVHTDSDCKIYLNGEYVSTGSSAVVPSGNYFVGAWNTSSSQNYEGLLSDFRIYATALSADDVKSLYQNCATIDPDGTIRGQIRS